MNRRKRIEAQINTGLSEPACPVDLEEWTAELRAAWAVIDADPTPDSYRDFDAIGEALDEYHAGQGDDQ